MKLTTIQAELKVPKDQRNDFGNYKYRSCEDIVEAVKPILQKNGFALTLSDDLVQVGAWNYVKATAMISDGKETHQSTAFAREQETKKGMDTAQITGSASSYARKYALNGLFAIDDTRDADTEPPQLSETNGNDHSESESRVRKATENRLSQKPVIPGQVVVHLGRTTKGKKVNELTPEQLTYFAEEFVPKSDADKQLQDACLKVMPAKEF